MVPICTDSLLTDWRMTGVVAIARADGGRRYACSSVFYLSKKKKHGVFFLHKYVIFIPFHASSDKHSHTPYSI